MKRYLGKGLPPSPLVAVVANDAIGNFVVATPLLQMLRRELEPKAVHYFGGVRTHELQSNSDLIDKSFLLHGRDLALTLTEVHDAYDLVINVEQGELAQRCAAALGEGAFVCGPCANLPFPDDARGDLWRDRQWVSSDLPQRYPFLETGWIAEVYARLAYLQGPVPPYRLPSKPTDSGVDVLIAASASLPEKLWPTAKWAEVIQVLDARGFKVGLLGAPPHVQGAHWKGADDESSLVEATSLKDLRGQFTLPEVVGALSKAKLVLSLDNGIMHLACSTPTPTVALFRYGIHRLWAPPAANLIPVVAEPDCTVGDIPVTQVVEAIERAL